ncbi:MAG: hypothetical protein JOY51_04955, partial [Nevskia sp.]|nr:hypothetical protein [Nevskia sp.]
LGSLNGCSKAALDASAGVSALATATANAPLAQRVPLDVGAYQSRIQTTLQARQGDAATLALPDGRAMQVPASLLPAAAVVGNTYIVALALTDSAASAATIASLDPAGAATIATAGGTLSLPAAALPTEARQTGHVAIQIYDNPKPLQAISFAAQVTAVGATTVTLQGNAGTSFQLPRALIAYPTLQPGDQYMVTLTSTNEPDSDWSGSVTSKTQDTLQLALKAVGTQVTYPAVDAPQAVQPGDFFALTLVKVTYQPGDLTRSQ